MNRRVPLGSLPVLAMMLFLGLVGVPATLAADGPQLTATTQAGREIDLNGVGFPADSDVQLVVLRNGADAGTQALHTDAAGSFGTTIPAGPGRGGRYTLTATAGEASASIEVVAVETAGGLGGGTQPTPPPTDVVASTAERGYSTPATIVAAGALLAAFAAAMAVALSSRRMRPAERRASGMRAAERRTPTDGTTRRAG